jgi:alpha-galactosidase
LPFGLRAVGAGAAGLSGTLRLTRNKPVYLERFELVLAADEKKSPFVSLHDDISPDSGLRLFQHGYHSWSWTGARQADETDNICLLKWKHNLNENPETQINSALPFSLPINVFPRKGKFHSEFLVLLETNTKFLKKKNGKCILFSTYGRGDQFLKFRIHLDPKTAKLEEFAIVWDGAGMHMPGSTIITLTQVKHFNSIHVRPRTRVRLKRTQPSPAEFLESCAKDVAGEFKTPKMENSVTGWCSWYYYYNKISEGVLLRNLRLVKEKKLNIDFFQIDDGWQKNIGDWLKTAPEFPSGMAFFSKAIKNEGLRPGIWLAPFIARPDSDVFKENKEFVLHDQHGDPVSALFNPLWGGHTYAFDVTHPRFKEWISETIRTIVFDWGYPYLKLDFLYSACYRGVYHDPRKGPAVRLRESLDLIRKVAGKKTFLLGCGCPIMPGIGPFDAMRIGRDVNSIWDDNLLATIIKDRNYPTAEGCLQNAITRSFMHRKFFVNDPDCILVRDTNTKLSLDQVHLMTAVMSLTGGMILLSDDLETLSPDRMEIFRMALKIHKECAKHTALPLGLMEDHFPRGLYNKAGYLGIWNPTSRAERIQILLPEGLGPKLTRSTNLWDNRRIPWRIEDDTLEMSLAPFESVLTKV